ncbi:MAG: aminotransferase class III-fold pyridoxal phosphate-dependent enzyme [Deltaproteobacteria bacterium]|nr:aminotransferase class III-fold pyridoxal phosphate-dependent enzyme [Deltaproteobacteria bacterium]
MVAIIQARRGSTRLPGKVLQEIAGQPMLWQVVRRARRTATLDQVVVATSTAVADDAIAAFCAERGIVCFRGSEDDVLDRYYQAARQVGAEVVVRLTADCPLLDPEVVDQVVRRFLTGSWDYVSNINPPTFPDGLDTEVFSFTALAQAWREASNPAHREHVTPYLRLSNKFRMGNLVLSEACPEQSRRIAGAEKQGDRSAHEYRWTVDDAADLEFVRRVYAALAEKPEFNMQDVISLLESRSDLTQINGTTIRNAGYYHTLYTQAEVGAVPKRPLTQSRAWFARSQRVIPGCAQTFSKGYTQYVQGVAPLFLQRGKGCRVWDVDGNEYIDYVQGLLANILGYAHSEVNAAAAAQYAEGHSFSLPHPLEVQLAERLTRLIPCAEMVRFGKNGSDATAGAVRAARAYTGRERVACCGYHGWQDWYIGSTTRHSGVPGAVRALTHPFPYNDLPALEKLLGEHPGEFAAVIMEPVSFVEPQPGYLQSVKELAHKHGVLLIFDEICSGFHFGLGGAQKRYGVIPDLACFGKAMGGGFPIACVVGRAEVMRIFEEIFFSFTFGGEAASLAAALKVLDILEQTDALARMEGNGRRLQEGFNALAREAGLAQRLECVGHPSWSLLRFRDANGTDSFLERSLFQQEAVKRGILLLVTHNLTAAHTPSDIEHTLGIYAAVFKTLARWLSDPDPARFLEGPMIQPVFRVR